MCQLRRPGFCRTMTRLAKLGTLLVALIAGSFGGLALAESGGFSEEDVRFSSGQITLSGTILVPDGEGRRPAIVLVHGAGVGPRESNRLLAEMFARRGIVTLIYDRRSEGYSQFNRSYDLLADDAIAAVNALRNRPYVDPDAVGLWGVSEGGWVVPLAASRSGTVDFAVLVATTGVSPAQQHVWSLETALRHQGVSGSLPTEVPQRFVRLLAGVGAFPEPYYDPVPVLEQVDQPVLALWGEKDRVEPAPESARIVREALERGGNTSYTLRFFPNADHDLYTSPDGFTRSDVFAPGYVDTVTSWIEEVARGARPRTSVQDLPPLTNSSRPITPLGWWEGWMQLGATVIPIVVFASYLAISLVAAVTHRLRGDRREASGPKGWQSRRWAPWLAVCGLVCILGFFGYAGFLTITSAQAVGPVFAGRPLPWLVLQALAVTTCAFTLALVVSWWSKRDESSSHETLWLGTLLVSGVLFVPWSVYWGLLVP